MRNFNLFLQLALTGVAIVSVPVVRAQRLTPSSPASTRAFSFGDRAGTVEYPAGWSEHHYANLHQLWNATPESLANMNPEEQENIARIETTAPVAVALPR